MATALWTEVAVPAVARTSGNLLASAARPDDESSTQWMDGLAWRPETCAAYQGFNPCAETELPELVDAPIQYALPVGYRVLDQCSVMSGRVDTDRARRQAEAMASYAVARELWTGELSDLDPYDIPGATDQVNARLASTAATTLTATASVIEAVAALEEAAGVASRGVGPVFIHGAPGVLGRAADHFERVGNELRTKTGSIVVADPGYPGTGPDGLGDGWLYATGAVAARLGPVSADTAPASTTDRLTNTRQVIAERMFVVTFDPCVHFAVQVTA